VVAEQVTRRAVPLWIGVLAVVCFLISLAFAYGAMLFLIIDCNEDTQSVCSSGGYGQFGIALVGLALSLGALIAGVLGRFRPGAWLCAASIAWATWIVVIFAVGETA
jgi:hypothetical protein